MNVINNLRLVLPHPLTVTLELAPVMAPMDGKLTGRILAEKDVESGGVIVKDLFKCGK